jgi:hypothetical protein
MVRDYWQRLAPGEQARIEAEAIDGADPETRASCMDGLPVMKKIMVRSLRRSYIRRLLNLPPILLVSLNTSE